VSAFDVSWSLYWQSSDQVAHYQADCIAAIAHPAGVMCEPYVKLRSSDTAHA